ncbi:isoprenylcysteine carboxylmethyltransferase family protein [Piscibacillus salipiscarius]|uniref:isoprenylcysteine carboxylmethyltransferase family protein n=1 Tax=Piscibacillus salipiscarius TaxID=299480 RepID=UPI0034E2D19A
MIESFLNHSWNRDASIIVFSLFILLQTFRFWSLWSLGRYWNTKVIVLPDAKVVDRGPYKWIKHPNYWIVGLELLVISLLFYAYITAIIFVSAHLWLMTKRIPLENRALKQYFINK